MNLRSPESENFKLKLGEVLKCNLMHFATTKIHKHQNVYFVGDRAEDIYFIESGKIKLLTISPGGKECLLAIHTTGDMFGELSLGESVLRCETATAMEHAVLKRIPCSSFFRYLSQNSLIEGFLYYLTTRLGDQQQLIANLITVDSEHRLGETLLRLAHQLGQPQARSTRITHKITHEELSEMVGTTRPRITKFMLKFRGLGLIDTSPEHFLIVKQEKLSEYLARVA